MSVLIKGMDMPKDGRTITITIFSSGEVSIGTSTYTKPICKNFIDMMLNYHAVEIPTPHGRLIDADILTERFENLTAQALEYTAKLNKQEGNHELWRRWSTIWAERSAYMHDLYDAPTVVESEEV